MIYLSKGGAGADSDHTWIRPWLQSLPGQPPGGVAPWNPKVTLPPLTIYPGATPALNTPSDTPRVL